MLQYFEELDGSLVFRENGETVTVTPWGENSLRVRAVFLGDIEEGSAALLETETAADGVSMEIGGDRASIANGNIRTELKVADWGKVLQIAREYKKCEIPLDVLVIDYYHWPRCGDWRFDEEYFPDPEAMVREVQEMGIRLMVSIWPQVDWRRE